MQKVTISICGEHVYAQPRVSALLFVLPFPPTPAVSARLQRLALLNGFNGHAVQWLYSARVNSRKALLALQPFGRSTSTHREKLAESVKLAGKVVAAWGSIRDPLPACLQGVTLWCMGVGQSGEPLCPPRSAKFRRYEP